MKWLLIGMAMVMLAACSTEEPHNNATAMPAPSSDRPDESISVQAKRDAAAVIFTGKLYVCDAGTLALYTPGVAPAQASLIRDTPHRVLPSGCTDPAALRSVQYAEAFNTEIVRHLLQRKPVRPERVPD